MLYNANFVPRLGKVKSLWSLLLQPVQKAASPRIGYHKIKNTSPIQLRNFSELRFTILRLKALLWLGFVLIFGPFSTVFDTFRQEICLAQFQLA